MTIPRSATLRTVTRGRVRAGPSFQLGTLSILARTDADSQTRLTNHELFFRNPAKSCEKRLVLRSETDLVG